MCMSCILGHFGSTCTMNGAGRTHRCYICGRKASPCCGIFLGAWTPGDYGEDSLPPLRVFLLCPRTHEATRATGGEAFAVPVQEASRNRIGHHHGRPRDAWGDIEFVLLARSKPKGDLTGRVLIVTEATFAVSRIRGEETFSRTPLFFANVFFAFPLAGIKTVGVKYGVG